MKNRGLVVRLQIASYYRGITKLEDKNNAAGGCSVAE